MIIKNQTMARYYFLLQIFYLVQIILLIIFEITSGFDKYVRSIREMFAN